MYFYNIKEGAVALSFAYCDSSFFYTKAK